MKTILYTPVILTIALITLSQVSAQNDPTTNAPSTTSTNANSCSGKFGANGWHHHGGGFAMLNLTPAEQQQLAGDFMQIKDNPQFVAAAQALAQSTQTLIQTSTSLIVQTDPSAAPILAKIEPQIAQLIQKAQLAQLSQLSQTNN
jgi:Spy/CpxP family protein refolding chaperone